MPALGELENKACFAVHFVPANQFTLGRGRHYCFRHGGANRALRMEQNSSQRRRQPPPRKPSAFENTIDDLTMKRLGRGSQYYGERPSLDDERESQIDEFLKPDPVLVTGGTGKTGQWIALGLMNQGFNVRCLTRDFDKAESIFGPSGSNLDVFQGDLANSVDVCDAVEGSIAIVCASGAPWWLVGGHSKVDIQGVQNLVDAATQSNSVRRVVLISCADDRGSRASAKREAEQIVVASGIPYVIFRAAALCDEEGGINEIVLSTDEDGRQGARKLSRIDLAQSICQALVYDRSIAQLRQEDPGVEFDFPSCIIRVENGTLPHVTAKGFWKKEFNRISRIHRDRGEPQMSTT